MKPGEWYTQKISDPVKKAVKDNPKVALAIVGTAVVGTLGYGGIKLLDGMEKEQRRLARRGY